MPREWQLPISARTHVARSAERTQPCSAALAGRQPVSQVRFTKARVRPAVCRARLQMLK